MVPCRSRIRQHSVINPCHSLRQNPKHSAGRSGSTLKNLRRSARIPQHSTAQMTLRHSVTHSAHSTTPYDTPSHSCDTPAGTLGRHSSLYRRVHETDRPRALLTGSANEWTGTDRPSALLPRQSPVPSRDRRANANGPSRDWESGLGGGGRAAEVGGAGRGRQRASKVVRSGMSERNQGAIDCGKLTADPLTLDYIDLFSSMALRVLCHRNPCGAVVPLLDRSLSQKYLLH